MGFHSVFKGLKERSLHNHLKSPLNHL